MCWFLSRTESSLLSGRRNTAEKGMDGPRHWRMYPEQEEDIRTVAWPHPWCSSPWQVRQETETWDRFRWDTWYKCLSPIRFFSTPVKYLKSKHTYYLTIIYKRQSFWKILYSGFKIHKLTWILCRSPSILGYWFPQNYQRATQSVGDCGRRGFWYSSSEFCFLWPGQKYTGICFCEQERVTVTEWAGNSEDSHPNHLDDSTTCT